MGKQGLLFDGAGMKKGAHFSKSRVFRYALWRIWDKDKPAVMFVGLNPSTADETVDDPRSADASTTQSGGDTAVCTC